ncbi:hypothetical protein AGLY_001441 [Aphis glycines]|uniref:Uncharacterized protein n=1 Tax=Aphis glycines TaxID=307491 RepID=A0A6G0U7K4_APHGL|nr:hypothetical protein AGLY_001441 [Aphis glycines]
MENLVFNFQLLTTLYLYNNFYELYLPNNLQIFMVLTNFCQITFDYFCFKFSSILTRPKNVIDTSKKNSQKNQKFQLFINSSKKKMPIYIIIIYSPIIYIIDPFFYTHARKNVNTSKCYDFSTTKLLANFRDFEIFRKKIRTFHKEPCIKFSSCFCYPTFFHQHFKKKFQKNQKLLLSINNSKKLQPYTKNRFVQKLVLRKNSRFPSLFFCFSRIFGKLLENDYF